jgi:hypothetical protein
MSVPVIRLSEMVGQLEMVSDTFQVFLNRRTGEFTMLSEDDLHLADEGYEPEDYPEWQQDVLAEADEVLTSQDWLDLPTAFEIHEWAIMRDFCDGVEDDEIREDLVFRVHGSGAFRMFRDGIYRYELVDAWHRFRQQAFERIAIDWLTGHGIPFVRDEPA